MKLQTITTTRSKLTVAEKLPFPIKRAYWLHGIDVATDRPGHAHRGLRRLMVAISGSFKVKTCTRGVRWNDLVLNNPAEALLIEPMTWVELSQFTPKAVCLVLASEEHDEADCIRDFTEFVRASRCSR